LRPKTKEKEVLFLAAAGESGLFAVRAPFLACGRAVAFWPAAERKVPYFCFGFGSFAAKTKAIKRFSALPEAKKMVAVAPRNAVFRLRQQGRNLLFRLIGRLRRPIKRI
jgi:hypothetical protein